MSVAHIKELEKIKLRKKDGLIVPIAPEKIMRTIKMAVGTDKEKESEDILQRICNDIILLKEISGEHEFLPSIGSIQKIIEQEIRSHTCGNTTPSTDPITIQPATKDLDSYPELDMTIPDHVRILSQESKKYFKNSLGEFVYYRTYSRWLEHEQRRETWIETVDRYLSFMKETIQDKLDECEYEEIRTMILEQKVMPSMRLLQFAGRATRATNVCAYNCSYIAPNKLEDFPEIMYILMCGSGAGFSVESKTAGQLPFIREQTGTKLPTYVIPDSREGWCDALLYGLYTWFAGNDVEFDYSQLRPTGARLKTLGGKSSGPGPLRQLLTFIREKIFTRQGGQLSTLDVHDIICKIGETIVAGGVRRSALISLSDLNDKEMRDSKAGHFYVAEPQRCLANNSAVYDRKPTSTEFLEEWLALMKSGSGERGIFNRANLKKTLPARRLALSDCYYESFGTNPCGEIILRSRQFCNLSEVIARPEDTHETLLQKIRVATILGTYQSTLTNFSYLCNEWKDNCEEERLLGVSITGQWDCPAVRNAETLRALKDEAQRINQEYAQRFGITASTCITCVKPSGTVSKTFDTASGMHPRFAQYYLQRIRIAATDALFRMMRDQGVPYHPEVGQSMSSANTFVLEFPVKSPEGCITKDDLSAVEQLEFWKMVKENYTEHNPSVTIYISEKEWITVADWIYKNWDIIGGLSFLPRTNHVYQLAPYEAIDEETYNNLAKKLGHIDFSRIVAYEQEDETDVKREAACFAGSCDLI
jgi:ribonucleoside-triphosphate reductase